jgi:hypothetical protein
MARLVSNIGKEQRKSTANARKALLYRQMAEAILANDQGTIAAFPKYVPRGKAPAWYLARAEQAEQASATAGEMASLLVDMEHRTYLDGLSPVQAWIKLVGIHGLRGDEQNSDPDDPFPTFFQHQGQLQHIAFIIDILVEDLPYLAPKLSTAQRHEAREFLRAKMEDLLEAFDG